MKARRETTTRSSCPTYRTITTSLSSIFLELLAVLATRVMFSKRLECQLNIPDDFADHTCADPQFINPLRIYPFQIYNSARPPPPGYHRRYIVRSSGTGCSDLDQPDEQLAEQEEIPSDITAPRQDQDHQNRNLDKDEGSHGFGEQQEMSGGLMHEPPAIRGPSQDWMSGPGSGARLSMGHERGER